MTTNYRGTDAATLPETAEGLADNALAGYFSLPSPDEYPGLKDCLQPIARRPGTAQRQEATYRCSYAIEAKWYTRNRNNRV